MSLWPFHLDTLPPNTHTQEHFLIITVVPCRMSMILSAGHPPPSGLYTGSEFPSTQPCMWAEGAAAATVRAHLGSAVRSCQKRWWVRGAHEWDTQRKFSGLELHLLYDSLCVCVYLVSVCVWTYTCTYKHIYLSVLSVYVSGRKQKKVSNGYLYMYNSIH